MHRKMLMFQMVKGHLRKWNEVCLFMHTKFHHESKQLDVSAEWSWTTFKVTLHLPIFLFLDIGNASALDTWCFFASGIFITGFEAVMCKERQKNCIHKSCWVNSKHTQAHDVSAMEESITEVRLLLKHLLGFDDYQRLQKLPGRILLLEPWELEVLSGYLTVRNLTGVSVCRTRDAWTLEWAEWCVEKPHLWWILC